MDEQRIEASVDFGLRLSADILTALVLTGTLSKEAAAKLIDDGLNSLVASSPPSLEPRFREIAATLSTQVGLAKVEFDRQMRKPE